MFEPKGETLLWVTTFDTKAAWLMRTKPTFEGNDPSHNSNLCFGEAMFEPISRRICFDSHFDLADVARFLKWVRT
jgi:hypothetical protein